MLMVWCTDLDEDFTYSRSVEPPTLSLTTISALRNLQIKGTLSYSCDRILDIGAYKGDWSVGLHNSGLCSPDAVFIMVEGNYDMKDSLREIKGINYDFLLTLLGSDYNNTQSGEMVIAETAVTESAAQQQQQQEEQQRQQPYVQLLDYYKAGELTLSLNPDAGLSNSLRRSLEEFYRFDMEVEKERAVLPLDSVLESFNYTGPHWSFDIIRLDTEGYEVEILRGALRTLKNSENAVIIMKTPVFPYLEGLPPIFDVHVYMQSIGYVLADLVELKYAPFEGNEELFSIDMIWVRRSRLGVTNWHREAQEYNRALLENMSKSDREEELKKSESKSNTNSETAGGYNYKVDDVSSSNNTDSPDFVGTQWSCSLENGS